MIINEPSRKETLTLRCLIVIGLLSILNFFYWFLTPEFIAHRWLFWLLMGPMVFDSFRIIYIWYHYWHMSVPVKPVLTKALTVDVFTTYFPGEPYDMVKGTLLAIQGMTYPHTTYLCDEANDAHLKEFCGQNGIIHVTRTNRIHAKAGNINNALKQASGDVCLILDPDHVPKEHFLDDVIPYFEDEKIGFVQSVQAYYNVDESLVAKGAAEQTFHFYGPVMMTMNTYGTVNAIGANCVFRRKALDSIGGHAPGLSEDMHTAMQLYAKGWTSAYVPNIYTKGLVPASLTSFYMQQLKWSRGTLELLVSAYPKLFKQFTWRQRIHFGLLPLHYLSGFIILISFLIPILSLFTAAMPWKGNMINFGLILIPVLTSMMGIRFYVQRWVMDRSERGTHLLGGLLMACTWWIFVIGVVYTIIRKKVPYLPTPKEDKELTHWKVLAPNILVGLLSIAAIIYGLSIDFTPFSVFMSGFALVNAGILFFTLVLAYEHQKPVHVALEFTEASKSRLNVALNMGFSAWQKAALPIVLIICALSAGFFYHTEYVKWGGVQPQIQEKNVINYIGIFAPEQDDGMTSIDQVNILSDQIGETFDILSFYMAWDAELDSTIHQHSSIPMITWEPWVNDDSHVYDLITIGHFDEHISEFADQLRDLNKPVFLRFAHEFDNPFYPWYRSDNLAASSFKNAWIHTYEIFKKRNAHNVIWIWNPWKAEHMSEFYPGRAYVDWIGINILNYEESEFKSLYEPYHEEIKKLPPTLVVISEFGTRRDSQNQSQWIERAFSAIEEDYSEIKSVIYFYSDVDDNWPAGEPAEGYMNWTVPDIQVMKTSFINKDVPAYVFDPFPMLNQVHSTSDKTSFSLDGIRGVTLTYGHDWRKSYHVLSRRKLLSDFERMKTLGLNTVKFSGNSVYDYNILMISKEKELDVSYGFWIPESMDFMKDSIKANELRGSIIRQIEQNKHHTHITSWAIQNDVLFRQKDFFHKPELLFQNRAYLIWLNNLVSDMKKIDPTRPILLDLEVNRLSIYHTQLLSEYGMGIDGLSLIVKDEAHVRFVTDYLKSANLPFVVFIPSWQDQHESNKLTFDGLMDRKGRVRSDSITARILKPATRLYIDYEFNYHAVVYTDEGGWTSSQPDDPYTYEWALVKCDKHGNYLAVKDIGTGPVLSLTIPENHDYFRLLLTVSDGTSVATTITTLNTPLVR